ncbi:RNA-binding protein FUS-like [Pollicipes pollicipes]|uniref:RNA-binding protein FUS-like n=1 Tax=Pollicipes pollicipes TaxID=41117 RepID=UPI0018852680|nr:RNA-binding protein FUS-like [Pollicipes pollicipes]
MPGTAGGPTGGTGRASARQYDVNALNQLNQLLYQAYGAAGGYPTSSVNYGGQTTQFGAQGNPYGLQPTVHVNPGVPYVSPSNSYATPSTPYGGQPNVYGAQPGSYGTQPGSYGAQPGAAAGYDPYQGALTDMEYAGSQQYMGYVAPPVVYDQQASADSSYQSYGPPPAPSYGHSGGGGYGGGGGYDNSPALSALALLGFLFFLNLIQQTLAANNGGTGGTGGTGGGGRSGGLSLDRERYSAELELRVRGALLDATQWQQMTYDTVHWLGAVQRHKSDSNYSCLQFAFCQLHQVLHRSFGIIGRLVAVLARSYVLSSQAMTSDVRRILQTVKFSDNASECSVIYQTCEE